MRFGKAGQQKDNDGKLAVFPAFQKVEGRRVLVVGSGDEAAAKVRLLSQTSALIEVVAEDLNAALAQAIENAGARHIAGVFRDEHAHGAALVFAASGDAELDRQVVAAARRFGVPANAVDRPELCDFYVGALVNRAPVAVAITSTGVGPVLARHIRARIEAMLPRETGDLARLAESFRETVARVISGGAERRRFWARFFSGPVADNVQAGRIDVARSEAQRLLNGSSDEAGFVWLVGAGPGAEDLLTLRAQRLLQEADVIVHDALVPEAVIAMGRRDARRIAVGKRKGAHSVSQAEINGILVSEASRGARVVRLKSGDPLIFGRAGEELTALREAGIGCEVVPGVTAAAAAAASARIPLTLRGVASQIVFATGHDWRGETLPTWAGLALKGATVAVYMGRSVAGKVADRLIDAGLAGSTPVAAVENASQPGETVLAGTLRELSRLEGSEGADDPVLIIIGEVVAKGVLEGARPLTSIDQSCSVYAA
ncbi:uroporphyrinogen-III C-methyltransferase [Stappia sp. F7233]|uniref:Uroporphyrinogen-III C-methyltransferase n=1 Tax=Stappia albiluteola TaxID=2758565 RepID=A0A839AHT7_9HYPH|nr:siroheme synthase CysG [Stappia albiluteola]MBA5778307.1 uroporphyrinogen-III C-methyltransferase [Stappia albiluteola]